MDTKEAIEILNSEVPEGIYFDVLDSVGTFLLIYDEATRKVARFAVTLTPLD